SFGWQCWAWRVRYWRRVLRTRRAAFKATKTEMMHLKPGDIFSEMGPEFWSDLGQRTEAPCYIRTRAPLDPVEYTTLVYRIEDNRPDAPAKPKMSPLLPPGRKTPI